MDTPARFLVQPPPPVPLTPLLQLENERFIWTQVQHSFQARGLEPFRGHEEGVWGRMNAAGLLSLLQLRVLCSLGLSCLICKNQVKSSPCRTSVGIQ